MKPTRPKYDLEFLYTSFPQRHRAEWYRWEFLRRNSNYRLEYDRFLKAHGAWLARKGYWYDLNKRSHWTSSDEKYFYTKIAPVIVRLCVKWEIGDLHPPDWRFASEREWEFREDRPSGPATGFPPELNWDHRLIKELFEMGFTGSGGNARRYGHLVILEFDLRWPMRDLLDFAKRVLPRAQENYKGGLKRQGGRYPTGRRRFEDYDIHLKVWDLKQKRKSATEIAKAIFSKDTQESALHKVRDHLKSAKRLIGGHYREIR
jgi:hypothetical protein